MPSKQDIKSAYSPIFIYDVVMRPITSCIFINTKRSARIAFMRGVPDIPCRAIQSKKLLLHIVDGVTPVFIRRNTPFHFSQSYVFTHLRASDAHFCGMLYEYFAHHQIPANDPIHLSYPGSTSKITQMLLLALGGVRVPDTIIFREEGFATNRDYIRTHCTFPLIYKTAGSQGRNVHLVETFEELELLVAKKQPHARALIQPFIPNTFDTRTLVAYDTILGSIKRTRTQGYLNNISRGAHASVYELTELEKDVVRNATRICKIDFAGVDIIHTPEGPVVLEVNKSPQVQGFEAVQSLSVFEELAKRIAKKYIQNNNNNSAG